jgi:hypothetical protein
VSCASALNTLGTLGACGAFGSDDAAMSEAGSGSDGAANDTAESGSGVACTKLTPGVGPPPLPPAGGPPETDCNGVKVDLATSDQHCGTCTNVCAGVPCVGGVCAKEPIYKAGFAVALAYARRSRFVLASPSAIIDMLPDGGDVRVIRDADSGTCCASLALEGDSDWIIYNANAMLHADRIAPNGSVSATVLLGENRTPDATFVVTADDVVFVQENGNNGASRTIQAVRKSDGTSHSLSTNEPYAYGLLLDENALVWAQEPFRAVDGMGGQIVRKELGSGDTRRSAQVSVSGRLGFDQDFIYYFDGALRELRRISKRNLDNATGETLAKWTGSETEAFAIGAFGDYVYVALTTIRVPNAQKIIRVHRCGGEPIVVARDPTSTITSGPHVYEGELYFTQYATLFRTPP